MTTKKRLRFKTVDPMYKYIEAGAALSEEHFEDVRDNVGTNISAKNKNYCELTALYWIWKHSTADMEGEY